MKLERTLSAGLYVLLKSKLVGIWTLLRPWSVCIAVCSESAVWHSCCFVDLSASTARHTGGVDACACWALWPGFATPSVVSAAAPVQQLKVLLLKRLFGHLCAITAVTGVSLFIESAQVSLLTICTMKLLMYLCVPIVWLILEGGFFSFFYRQFVRHWKPRSPG